MSGGVTFIAEGEVEAYVNNQCTDWLGVSYQEALAIYETGVWDGTLVEVQMRMWAALLTPRGDAPAGGEM